MITFMSSFDPEQDPGQGNEADLVQWAESMGAEYVPGTQGQAGMPMRERSNEGLDRLIEDVTREAEKLFVDDYEELIDQGTDPRKALEDVGKKRVLFWALAELDYFEEAIDAAADGSDRDDRTFDYLLNLDDEETVNEKFAGNQTAVEAAAESLASVISSQAVSREGLEDSEFSPDSLAGTPQAAEIAAKIESHWNLLRQKMLSHNMTPEVVEELVGELSSNRYFGLLIRYRIIREMQMADGQTPGAEPEESKQRLSLLQAGVQSMIDNDHAARVAELKAIGIDLEPLK